MVFRLLPPPFRFLLAIPAFFPAFAPAGDVDLLDQPALQEAFRILKEDYIRPDALSYEEINKAALDGLLRRLDYGAKLVPVDETESPKPASGLKFHSDLLTPEIGYVRFASYGPDELPLLDKALERFLEESAQTLILDLRVPCETANLEVTARILDRLVNPNAILFKLQRPREDRPQLFVSQVTDVRWKGKIVALVDRESSCGAELIGAVLKQMKGAFLAGEASPGLTVEYEEVTLNPSTRIRFAVAEILLADGSSLFRSGLEPDFPIKADLPAKHRILAASEHSPLTNYLFDRARPRMNEAALVHETDPELDYHVARSKGELTVYDQPPLQDVTLQRTIDLLMTVDFIGGPGTDVEN